MTSLRRLVPLLVATMVSCSREATQPSELPANLVLGTYGGEGVEVVATATTVQVSFTCDGALFERPLLPWTDGRFMLGGAVSRAGTRWFAMTVQGAMSGDQIAFQAVRLDVSGEVYRSEHVVYRDRRGSFGQRLCML